MEMRKGICTGGVINFLLRVLVISTPESTAWFTISLHCFSRKHGGGTEVGGRGNGLR